MNLTELWAEIEQEFTWRTEEIRFLDNCLASLSTTNERNKFRRASVLLLYAHLEGFCVFSLRHFIRAINDENLVASDAHPAIAASALASVFAALRNPNTKCDIFQKTLPDEGKLHRFARDQEFVERTQELNATVVSLEDDVVDSESNLKPIVLRKNLFRLGLPHDLFKHLDGTIHRLLRLRNKIAHGERKAGIEKEEFDSLKDAVFEVMKEIKSLVMAHLQSQSYLRPA